MLNCCSSFALCYNFGFAFSFVGREWLIFIDFVHMRIIISWLADFYARNVTSENSLQAKVLGHCLYCWACVDDILENREATFNLMFILWMFNL